MKLTQLKFVSVISLCLAIVVVILGAYTRLVDAGLGCPDWPTCYGHFWVPNSVEEIHVANQAFSETPVETDKTWPEQIHRIFASNLGLAALIMFGLSYSRLNQHAKTQARWLLVSLVLLTAFLVARILIGAVMEWVLAVLVAIYFVLMVKYRRIISERDTVGGGIFNVCAFLIGLVIVQGLFGMWTVTLNLWPQVVTAHLLGGFAVLTTITLATKRLFLPNNTRVDVNGRAKAKSWLPKACLIVLVVQIFLGGWTSSNYAALACPDFPLCQNTVFPSMDLVGGFNIFQSIGPNYLGGQLDNESRIAVHYVHRLGAMLTAILLGVFAFRLLKSSVKQNANVGKLLIGLLILQLGLGVSNVIFSLPLPVAVAHNFVAACLFATLFITVVDLPYSRE